MSLMSSSTVTAGRSILTGKELHCTNSLCQKFPPQYRGDFVDLAPGVQQVWRRDPAEVDVLWQKKKLPLNKEILFLQTNY